MRRAWLWVPFALLAIPASAPVASGQERMEPVAVRFSNPAKPGKVSVGVTSWTTKIHRSSEKSAADLRTGGWVAGGNGHPLRSACSRTIRLMQKLRSRFSFSARSRK